MYTVKQVTALTGVPAATLRAWEHRYDVVTPHRSASGYRLYDETHVARLRTMATLVADGVPASRAAALLAEVPGAGRAPEPGGHLPRPDLVVAARQLDPVAAQALLSRQLHDDDPEAAITGWLLPELGRVGDAWQRGELSVAQEHFVSGMVSRTLATLWASQPHPEPGQAPVVVLGLPSGVHHALGLTCFGLFLRRRGIDVVDLGADVPLDAWRTVTAQLQPRAVVLAATRTGDARKVDDVATALARHEVWVGGPAATRCRVAKVLPAGLAAAADQLCLGLLAGVRS